MDEQATNKPPIWFWIVSAIALIWNILGIGAYYAQTSMTDEVKAALPEADRIMYENLPSWYMIVFAVAIFGGAIGSLLLLLKKKWANIILLISLIAILIQMSYLTFSLKMANAMTPLIIIVGLLLVWLAKHATKKHWIT